MTGFLQQYGSLISYLLVGYTGGMVLIFWIPFSTKTSISTWQTIARRFFWLNLLAAFGSTWGSAILHGSIGVGSIAKFGESFKQIAKLLLSLDSTVGVLFILNSLLFLPAGFAAGLAGFSIARTTRIVFLAALSIELLQFFIFTGVASADDLILNTFSGMAGSLLASYCSNLWLRSKNEAISQVDAIPSK